MKFMITLKMITFLIALFIIKIRFPKGTPISTIIERRYGRETLTIFRQTERLSEQVIRTNQHIAFLNSCKVYNLTPKFLRFKLYNKKLQHNEEYRTYQRKLLDNEIKTQFRKLARLKRKLDNTRTTLKTKVSRLDHHCLLHRVRQRNKQIEKNSKETHKKKLLSLGSYGERTIDPKNVIFNLSNVTLTEKQIDALAYGLEFCLPPKKLNKIQYTLNFEKLAHQLKKHPTHKTDFNLISKSLAHIANSTFYDFPNWKHHLPSNDEIRKTLKSLIENPDIIVTRPDKGRGIVIINKDDYITKTKEILNDETKFEIVKEDPLQLMFSLQKKMNNFTKGLRDRWKISCETYNYLHLSSARPGILYGLPKVHKQDTPIRPIMSAINSFGYNLAKLLVPILQPVASSPYTIESTQKFAQEIQHLYFDHPIYLAIFDITSLYTNIPVDETIEITLDSLCDHDDKFVNLTRKELKKMLELSSKDNVFYFNKTLYRQTDGCAMGSPLSGTLANIFMSYHEQRWLEDCPDSFVPVFYRRYQDDTFVIFKTLDQVELFKNYINSKHPNIKFTHETETNQALNFLDLTITHEHGHFSTQTFRKHTHTGLGTQYTSFTPHSYKTNIILTLLHRAYITCSSWVNIHNEIEYLKEYFSQNGYPAPIIHRYINHFLSKLHTPSPKPISAPKQALYVSLPYLGPFSYHIRNQMKKLLTEAYPHLRIQYVFRNKFTIGSLFPFKDRLPMHLLSNVVYQYKCRCSATYVGKTECNLGKRMAEHEGVSERTGERKQKPLHSAIRDHSRKHHHPFDRDNFSVLSSAKDKFSLALLEAMFIKVNKPKLNGTQDSEQLITI